MITTEQVNQLAKQFQIDQLSVVREYIQLLVLNQLYQYEEGNKIYFKGGTTIRLIYRSAHFSEDLDFSTQLATETIANTIKKLTKDISRELLGVSITKMHKGQDTQRFRLRYHAQEQKYPLTIRLDFNKQTLTIAPSASGVTTRFPLTFIPVVMHMSPQEILAEKIHAIHKRSKGRDVYDLWFLLSKGIQPDYALINTKLDSLRIKFNLNKFESLLMGFSVKELQQDLRPFLPQSQRAIIGQLPQMIVDLLGMRK